MSAVAIINQLLFVFNLCIWGALAGAGIFGAQYYGQGNMEGVRQTLRMKLLIAVGLLVIAFGVLLGAGRPLIELYISADTTAADAAATLEYALGYLRVMLVGLIPFALTQAYASTLRESGQTTLPMRASMIAMGINFVFNGLLIFGLFGFPALGVVGAGIATSLSRFVEFVIVVSGRTAVPSATRSWKACSAISTLTAIWPARWRSRVSPSAERMPVEHEPGHAAAMLFRARHPGHCRHEHYQHHHPDF